MYIPFEQLPSHSQVWIYQADRSFSLEEEKTISESLNDFCLGWTAHGNPLQTSFKIEYNQFVILSVDESSAGASGCSIDGSVRTLKELGNQLHVDFFDRTKVAFLIDGNIQTYALNQVGSRRQRQALTTSLPINPNGTRTGKPHPKNPGL